MARRAWPVGALRAAALVMLRAVLAAAAGDAATDLAALRGMREAILDWEEMVAAGVAALAADNPCCDPERLQAQLARCNDGVCPQLGWTAALDAPACSWAGVTCGKAGRVTKLLLLLGLPRDPTGRPDRPLRVSPAFLDHLASLTELEWVKWDLYPAELVPPAPLPAAWAALRRLRDVRLSEVRFAGGLPADWVGPGALPQLRWLRLEMCGLTGSVPSGVTRGMPRLQHLDLSRNRLAGGLPAGLASSTLEHIDLAHNELTGTLPVEWGRGLPNLETLQLRDNRLSGTFPPRWQRWAKLSVLTLSGNALSGSLPPSFFCPESLPLLTYFDISGNRLSGSFPFSPSACVPPGGEQQCAPPAPLSRGTYYFSHNNLTGRLPEQPPCRFQGANSLDLSNNGLSGTLPPAWLGSTGRLNRMTLLSFANNRLSGRLPPGFPALLASSALLPLLDVLNLSHNQLTGPLASEPVLGGPASVPAAPPRNPSWDGFDLYLGFNRLTGTLPASWANGSSHVPLIRLGLEQNRLTGTLPASWASEAALLSAKSLNLSGNALEGTVPPSWLSRDAWPELYCIDVSGNSLRGGVNASDTQRDLPFRLVLLPGNDQVCQAATGSNVGGSGDGWAKACTHYAELSYSMGAAAVPGRYLVVPPIPCDAVEPNVSQSSRSAGGAVPLCSTEQTQMPGAAGQRRHWWLASGAGAVLLLAVAAAAAAMLPRRRRGLAHATQHLAADPSALEDATGEAEKLLSLEGCHAPPDERGRGQQRGTDAAPLPGGMHADLHRLLLQLLPPAGQPGAAHQARPGPAPHLPVDTSSGGGGGGGGDAQLDSVRAALASGSLQLSLKDLEFARQPLSGGGYALVELGRGAQGTVLLASLYGALPVAVKVARRPQGEAWQEVRRRLDQEVALLHRCRHPGILQLLGVCQAGGLVLIVTELMRGGSLHSQLHRPELRFYARGRELLLQVAAALQSLHQRRVIHMDLKAGNVLVDADLRCARICDVGLAGRLVASKITARGGTALYAAPEQLLGRRVDARSDLFSLGLVMCEVVTGRRITRRGQALDPRVPEDCPPDIADLIAACTQIDPEARPALADVVAALAREPQFEAPGSL